MIQKWDKFVVFIIITIACLSSAAIGYAQTSKYGITKFHPKPASDVLNNPYMGFAPDASGGPYPQPHRLVYFNVTWKELEPEKGNYLFETIERVNQFEYWHDKGVSIIFRIVLDYPQLEKHKDIPDWLYEEIDADGTWYNIDYGQGFSPNYSNSKLIAEHQKLLQAIGERYNSDNRIAFVELGSLGHWGEWHTKDEEGIFKPFPKLEVANQYIQHYLAAFPDKHLLMRRPHELAKENHMGLFNDMFGDYEHTVSNFLDWIHKGYTFWLTDEDMPAMPEYWIYAPSGGEFAYSDDEEKYLNNESIKETLTQLSNSHSSWFGPSSPADIPYGGAYQKNIDTFLKTIGYRFVLATESHPKKATPGSSISIDMLWKNTGIAPFYFNWPLELSLSDSNGNIVYQMKANEDIRKWLPGNIHSKQILRLPGDLSVGTYTLCVAILDPNTNNPGVELAIGSKRSDNRYSLGSIEVIH